MFHSSLKLELCRHACRRRDPIISTCRYGKNMPTTALVKTSFSTSKLIIYQCQYIGNILSQEKEVFSRNWKLFSTLQTPNEVIYSLHILHEIRSIISTNLIVQLFNFFILFYFFWLKCLLLHSDIPFHIIHLKHDQLDCKRNHK